MFKGVRTARFRLLALPSVGLLALLSGCIRQTVNGSETTSQYELWVPILMILGGLVLVPLGWVVRPKNSRFGWALLILGPVLALGFGPTFFTDKVTINDSSLHVRTGFWAAPTDVAVKFDDVRSLRLTSETRRTRRGGRTTNHYFNFDMKSGPSQKVQFDTKLMSAARDRVLAELEKRDVPVVDMTGEE
jgi:hypothetical protein